MDSNSSLFASNTPSGPSSTQELEQLTAESTAPSSGGAPDSGAPAPAAPVQPESPGRPPASDDMGHQVSQLKAQLDELTSLVRPAPQPEAVPDPDEDPIGALRHERQQRQRMEAHLVLQNVQANYVGDARQFVTQTPDFHAAYTHLLAGRIGELRSFGASDDAIRRQIQQDELSIVYDAQRRGKRPTQVLYDLAKARGYQPPVPATQPGAPAADRQSSPPRGQRPAAAPPSLERIVEMKGDDFDKAVSEFARGRRAGGGLFRH